MLPNRPKALPPTTIPGSTASSAEEVSIAVVAFHQPTPVSAILLTKVNMMCLMYSLIANQQLARCFSKQCTASCVALPIDMS